MKKIKYLFLLLFAISFCVVSCEKDNDPVVNEFNGNEQNPNSGGNNESIVISNSQNQTVFQAQGGEIIIEFSSTSSWTASTSESWCTVSPSSGNGGESSITLTAKENTTYEDRQVILTIKSGKVSKNVTITQKQNNAILVSTNLIEVSSDKCSAKIELQSNVDYTYSISDDATWIHEVNTRSLRSSTIELEIDQNREKTAREGKITIVSGSLKETVTIHQQEPDFAFDNNTMILFVGQTQTTNMPDNVTSVRSTNEFAVSVKSSGKIEAKHEGGSFIIVNEKYELFVMVVGLSTYLNDAYTSWGKTVQEVKEKHSGYTPSMDDGDMLSYDNIGNFTTLAYSFEEGKLNSTMVIVPTGNLSKILEWVRERYILINSGSFLYDGINGLKLEQSEDDYPIFNSVATTFIGIDKVTKGGKSYYSIFFADLSYLGSSNTRSDNTSALFMQILSSYGFERE